MWFLFLGSLIPRAYISSLFSFYFDQIFVGSKITIFVSQRFLFYVQFGAPGLEGISLQFQDAIYAFHF